MADDIPKNVIREEPTFISKYGLIIGGVIGFVVVSYILSIMKWSLVDQAFFGGWFNTTFWGVQLYIFFIPLAMFLYFAAYAFWVHMKWNMMTPFHGLWFAQQAQTGVNFVTDLNLNFRLMSEAASKLIFEKDRYNNLVGDNNSWWNRIRKRIRPVEQSVDIATYLQGGWDAKPVTNIGTVPAGILLDAYRWAINIISPEREAIKKAVDIWNDANMNDQVHSLTKAWQYMNEGKIPVPEGVKLYVTVPWVRINNAYPREKYAAETIGFIMQIAQNIMKGEYNKGISMTFAAVIIFIIAIVFAALMFVMKIMTHVPGTK